jgi:hypothetical protein
MNDRFAIGCLVCSLLGSAVVLGQAQIGGSIQAETTAKHGLFSQLPQKIPCAPEHLEAFFQGQQRISVQVAPELLLQGEVIDQVDHNSSVRSIRIRLSSLGGAIFTLSREVLPNKDLSYVGTILALGYTDMLVLRLEKGQYYFTHVDQRLVVAE